MAGHVLLFITGQRQLEEEAATPSRLTFDADTPPHALDQVLANGQTQPAATIASAGVDSGLLKGPEKCLDLGLGEADAGILDFEQQCDAIRNNFV